MSFDVDALRAAVQAHGRVTRVVVAEVKGSAPREVGASMLVWDGGQSGTIGGGALEFEAAEAARHQDTPRAFSSHALGPDLGQCCGGSVILLNEVYTQETAGHLEGEVIARAVKPGSQPLAVTRILNRARAQGLRPAPQMIAGWMIEPIAQATRPLWIWGAGHVGRALIEVLSPLPEYEITWIDVLQSKFPSQIPASVSALSAQDPDRLVPHAPSDARHLILTYSHQLDLALCHRLLGHGFDFAGLIGSKTKWARFRARLLALGHSPEQIARLTCPIGLPALGKHPHAIAIGVAAELMALSQRLDLKKEHSA